MRKYIAAIIAVSTLVLASDDKPRPGLTPLFECIREEGAYSGDFECSNFCYRMKDGKLTPELVRGKASNPTNAIAVLVQACPKP